MAKFGKPKIDPKLLKKEVVKKNKQLSSQAANYKKQNTALKNAIENSEKVLDKCSAEVEVVSAGLEKQYSLLDSVKVEIEIKNKTALDLQNSNQELVTKNNVIQVQVETAEHELNELNKNMKMVENKILIGAEKTKYNQVLEKDAIILEKSIESLKDEEKEVKEGYKIMTHNQKAKFDKYVAGLKIDSDKMLKDVTELRVNRDKMNQDLQASMKNTKSTISNLREKVKKEKAELEDSLLELRGESAALKSLIVENKGKLQIALQDCYEIEERQQLAEKRTEKAKDDFEIFKVKAFEEVAKLKLKGKLETIDKAGLADAFN